MKLQTKLLLAFGCVGVLAIGSTAWLAYHQAYRSLQMCSYERLTGIREAKRRQIEAYFDGLSRHLTTLAALPSTRQALASLTRAFNDLEASEKPTADRAARVQDYYGSEFLPRLPENPGRTFDTYHPGGPAALALQDAYLVRNPHPTGQKDQLRAAGDSAYDRAHDQHHALLRRYQKTYGFYDVFLIDAKSGRIVYSVFKEVDFATSLRDGPYRQTNLAKAFGAAIEADPDTVVLVDFEPYAPSYNAPACFLATPVRDAAGQTVGVLAAQAPIDAINDVMTSGRHWVADGLGHTGETYLVGADQKMRSDSRFLIEEPERFFAMLQDIDTPPDTLRPMREHATTILYQQVDTPAARAALAGRTDTRLIEDYRGVPVLSAFAPVRIAGVNWALLSEIDAAEAFAPASRLRSAILVAGVGVLALILLVGMALARGIARPVTAMTRAVQTLGAGDLSARVNAQGAQELAQLGQAFNQMAGDLQKTTVSKQHVDGIVEAMLNALLVTDYPEDGRPPTLQKVNGAAVTMLTPNTDPKTLTGRPITELFGDGPMDWLDTVRRDGSVAGIEQAWRRADGSTLPVLFGASVLRDPAGRPESLVLVGQDLTEHHRAEQARRDLSHLQHDMDVARKVQQSLLPTEALKLDQYAVAGWNQPADATGGDYYDWLTLPDGRVIICIADATGHGIGPAMVAAVCRAYLRASVQTAPNLGDTVKAVNDLLADDLADGTFLTAVVADLDPQTHQMQLTSAGHGPNIFYHARTGHIEVWGGDHWPLGLSAYDQAPDWRTFTLEPGDMLVLTTDGFFEWQNHDGEHYGTDRLADFVAHHHHLDPESIIQKLHDEVLAFANGTPQTDDLTAVIIKRHPPPEVSPARPEAPGS